TWPGHALSHASPCADAHVASWISKAAAQRMNVAATWSPSPKYTNIAKPAAATPRLIAHTPAQSDKKPASDFLSGSLSDSVFDGNTVGIAESPLFAASLKIAFVRQCPVRSYVPLIRRGNRH